MALLRHQIYFFKALSSPKPAKRHRYSRPAAICKSSLQFLSNVRDLLSRQQAHHNVLVVQDLVFGASFTDHMFLVEHIDGKGWCQPVIKPFGNISMHPAAQTLHYGVCCFEGMKAYLGKDGKARLFRCDCCTLVTCRKNLTITCKMPVSRPTAAKFLWQ